MRNLLIIYCLFLSFLITGCQSSVAVSSTASPVPVVELSQQKLDELLFEAVKKGNRKRVVELLQQGANPNATEELKDGNPAYSTLLNRAVGFSEIEIVEILLQHGADINKGFVSYSDGNKEWLNSSPLNTAVMSNNVPMIELFIKYGASLQNEKGLIFNAHQEATIEFLVKNGVDINERAHDGSTALIFWACRANDRLVKILLRYDADPNIKSDNGLSALECAKDNPKLDAKDRKVFAQILKDAGARE